MNIRIYFKMLLVGVCLTITEMGFSQPIQRAKAHYDELHRLVCTCGNILVKCDYTGKQHKHMNLDCAIYKYAPCEKCGTIWECHKYLSGKRPDDFKPLPSAKKRNAGKTIHVPIKDSCYSDVEELGMGLECHIIKLKRCKEPLYCYVEGENKVYLVESNMEKSFCKEIGKDKKIHITHDKNSIPGMTVVK